MKNFTLIVIIVVTLVLILASVFYQVQESNIAVITQFGKPVGDVQQPGLHIKLPYPFQRVNIVDSRLLAFDPQSSEFLTKDKKNLIVDAFMLWSVEDPVQFLISVKDRAGAEARLADLLFSAVGTQIGQSPFSALISDKPGEQRLSDICGQIQMYCNEVAMENFGIKVKSALIKRLSYPPQNRVAVFERMKAERSRIARSYRSEGEENAQKIRSEADLASALILADAEQQALVITGNAEADAADIYRTAIQKDPEFYRFLRSLDAYEKFLDDQTTFVLPNDSELLQVLRDGAPR